jgi:transposase
MPGKHITLDRVAKYRSAREKWSRPDAARMALISIGSARRIDQGTHYGLRSAVARPSACRTSKLAMIWSEEASPYIAAHPDARAKTVFVHLLEQAQDGGSPLLASHRRSFERWYVRWKVERGIRLQAHSDLSESYAFLRSAHQGSFVPTALLIQKDPIPDMPLVLKTAVSSSLRLRNRALFILGATHGVPLAHISSYLMLARSTIGRWSRKLKVGGPKQFLSVASREHPGRDSPHIKATLFKVLHSPPTCYGFSRTNWRAVDLKSAMQTEGVITSLWTIRQIVRKEGYHWRKARVSLTSTDQKYREKVDRIKSILANLQENESFFSVDEYGPFSIRLISGRQLVAPGVVPVVPQRQKSRGHLILTAALELGTNQITHFYSEKKNTTEMIKMIDVVRRAMSTKAAIYFSWDAASWHMSKALDKRIEFWNGWAAYDGAPKIVLVPLPARAQFLNVIESVFSGMARAVIHNSDFADDVEAKKVLDGYIKQRNAYFLSHPRRAGNKIWGSERLPSVFNETENFKDPWY